MPRPATDVTVIGAGIVGLATAYALVRQSPGLGVTVIEKEDGPARHQTGRNSGVIHSGIYYRPGSFKARYALAGSAETPKFCAEHGIPYEITGKLIVATTPAELPRLHALVVRGREHGLTVKELGRAQIAAHEPEVAGLAAIHVASTGICDFPAITRALARLVEDAAWARSSTGGGSPRSTGPTTARSSCAPPKARRTAPVSWSTARACTAIASRVWRAMTRACGSSRSAVSSTS